ncbi:MAG: hypothetical protein IKB20_00470 [Clostridia bacterium]|nr:hypothetical protein [Clostridia bacterium]
MNRKKLYRFSLITLAIGLFVLFAAYFCFHFVTDEGITLVWHAEAGKPFVTILIGVFGVLFMFASAMSALIALVFVEKK